MRFRNEIAKSTDERSMLVNEIVVGIKLIKMFTWEIPFFKMVAKIRE